MRLAALVLVAGCGVTAIRPVTPPPAIDTAPAFTLVSHEGATIESHAVLDKGHAVLVFYRGHW